MTLTPGLLSLGLEAFGLGLVFNLALALFKAKVKVTNILPNTVYLGIITLTVHWYTSVIGTAIVRRQDFLLICCGLIEFCTRLQLQAITIEFDLSLDICMALALKLPALLTSMPNRNTNPGTNGPLGQLTMNPGSRPGGLTAFEWEISIPCTGWAN